MHVIVQIKGIDKQDKHDEKFLSNILTTYIYCKVQIYYLYNIDLSNFDVYWARGVAPQFANIVNQHSVHPIKRLKGRWKYRGVLALCGITVSGFIFCDLYFRT